MAFTEPWPGRAVAESGKPEAPRKAAIWLASKSFRGAVALAAHSREQEKRLKILSKRPGTEWCVISVGGELSRAFDDSLDVGNDLLFEGGCVWEGWHVRRRVSLYGSVKPVE